MKVTIDGYRFDTDKAKVFVTLYKLDEQSNQHRGEVYMSTTGVWYVFTPSQWANRHSWMVMSPEEILNDYDSYLTEDKKAQIAEAAGLAWE